MPGLVRTRAVTLLPPPSDKPTPELPLNGRQRRAALKNNPLQVAPSLSVIGVDPSATSMGVVILGSDMSERYAGTICPDSEGPERLMELFSALDELARIYGPFAVAMRESYAMGSTNRPYLLGEVGGITQLVLFRNSIALYECAPKVLKKFATGNASASKAEVMTAIGSRGRGWFDTDSDDVADAYVLARAAACIAGYAVTDERAALEALRTIQDSGNQSLVASKKAKRPKKRAPRMPNLSKQDLDIDE